MLDVKLESNDLDKLLNYINFVKKMKSMKTDVEFQKYIQDKCLSTVNNVAQNLINAHNTTNEDLKNAYLQNNKIKNISDKGFTIYNDLTINNGKYDFCIALAFEYGTGLIGKNQNIEGAWDYNINENTVIIDGEEIDGWWISKEKAGNTQIFGESKSGNAVVTQGYEGMEIYRYSAIEIKKQLPKWVVEYKNSKGGVST